MDAEKAHNTTMKFAKVANGSPILQSVARLLYDYQDESLSQNLWGLSFRNPVGLAAGFDKNGEVARLMEAIGMGFVELGSITANPSTGNPKPRAFRLPDDESLINRMGLNNDGAKTIVKRLKNTSLHIPLGINIAKTHDASIMGDRAIEDYLFSYREAKEVADYITVNISCPNTGEGKTFEDPAALAELLDALDIKSGASAPTTLVKLSVDLTDDQLKELVEVCEDHKVNGYVATNTSSMRQGLHTSNRRLKEIGRGGLSGRAIARRSTEIIRQLHIMTQGRKTIIGVGGVNSFQSALEKLKAGADLLQIYTGLIYEGPALIKHINRQLATYLKTKGLHSIQQLRQSD